MPTVTAQLLADLDDTGNFSYAFDNLWIREQGFDLPKVGRSADLGLAEPSRANFRLDNRDGRFSPKNTGSPYYDLWHPYHRIKAIFTYNSVDYELFHGIITHIEVDSDRYKQMCYVQAEDLMYVLRRTDIKCPLMSGYTGPIINRLLDYAELGEWITNPRFDAVQLLTGYTAIGTGSLSRVTSSPVLEGAAACVVTTPAANDGIRYTVTGQDGAKVAVAVYVQAVADEGNVYLQIEDNLGTRATGSDTPLQFGRWVRLSATGTYDGSSTSQYVQVRSSSSSGAGSFRVGAFHATPFNAAIARAVDQGETWLDAFSWFRPYGEVDALSAIQQVTENELGALFYFNGPTATFEDKAHRWVSPHTSAISSFSEKNNVSYVEEAQDAIKEVVLDFPQYIEGAAGTILWELDRVPVAIEASGTVTFEMDFGGGTGKSVILPVAGTDYIANAEPGGGGADETSNLLITAWQDWGNGAEITLENQVARPIYLTSLVIRGTPVRVASDRTPARSTASGGPGLAATLSHEFAWNGRATSVEAWANYLANRYATSRERVSMSLSAPYPTAALSPTTFMTEILSLDVSDRISVTNTTLPFSPKLSGVNYYIESMSRRFTGESVEATYELAPVEASYFIIGTSTIGGAAVIAP